MGTGPFNDIGENGWSKMGERERRGWMDILLDQYQLNSKVFNPALKISLAGHQVLNDFPNHYELTRKDLKVKMFRSTGKRSKTTFSCWPRNKRWRSMATQSRQPKILVKNLRYSSMILSNYEVKAKFLNQQANHKASAYLSLPKSSWREDFVPSSPIAAPKQLLDWELLHK